MDPKLIMIPAAMSASCAFMLPVATAPNVIMFSTGKFSIETMAREGFALNLIGAVVITTVCLMPEFLIVGWNVPFYFGGTSLLIIVVVTMDFMSQVQAHMMSHQYEGLLKKANLKGYGRAGVPR